MTALLKLNPLVAAFIASLISIACAGILAITVRIFFRERLSKVTTPFVHQMSLRIGTMHALVVALVFGVMTGELIKLQNTCDSEAVSAANIYYVLDGNPSEEAIKLRNFIPVYMETVIEKDWAELSEMANDLPAWKLLAQMQKITMNWNTTTESDDMLRKYVFENLNTMAKNRNIRIIEQQAPNLPMIFWGIAIIGYFLTIMPYFSVELDKRRFFLISCYAIIIGVIFYGIVVLDKPFISRVIKPVSFEVIYNDIKTSSPSSPVEIEK